jgi:hypothetical protein
VRNALQVLCYGAMRQEDEKMKTMRDESVARIDWALREVLQSDDTAV